MAGHLEVHEHCFISGNRAAWAGTDRGRLVHSHEGGDVSHEHPDTGPSSYTIDKDDWFLRTGLKGGGRKKFTAKPKGEQFPLIPRTREQNSFEVVVCDPPANFEGTGGGLYAMERMRLALGMEVSNVRDLRKGR